MIDTDKYEGHLTGEDERQTWCWSKWMLKNAETKDQMDATAELLTDAPLLLEEVLRLRDLVEFAIAAIDSNHCYMGEEAQVDLRDYLKELLEGDD